MTELDGNAMDCLRKIAQGRHGELDPCANDVLQRLLSLGLVECVPRLYLPLEWARRVYRITFAGEAVLRQG